MDKAEFDQFADEYERLHARSVALSGEAPAFFARYKVAAAAADARRSGLQPRQILDFGAGVGNSLPYLHEYFPQAAIVCADVSPRSMELSRQRFPAIPAQYVELHASGIPLPDASIDLAFTACVFHHIEAAEHPQWLRELRRVLRPSGHLFLFEHNPLNPLTLAAVHDCPFDRNARLIGARTMRRRIAQAGWEQARIRYRLFFPHALRALRPLENWLGWLPLGAQYSIEASSR